MNVSEFDELIKRKFEQNDFAYNPDNWQRLSQQLGAIPVAAPQRRKFIALWPVAIGIAAAALAMVLMLPLWMHNDTVDKGNNIAAVSIPANVPPVLLTPRATLIGEAGQAPVQKQQRATATVHKTTPVKKIDPADNNLVIASKQSEAAKENAVVIVDSDKGNAPILVPKARKEKLYDHQADIDVAPSTNKNAAKTAIDLVGGVNYGGDRRGFALGASANRKLSKKLFLEGSIAYVNTNESGNSFNDYTPAQGFSPADKDPGISNVVDEKMNTSRILQNLSYVQFSPVLGYKISDRLSLSAGPDFQKLLLNEGWPLNEFEQDIPSIDMGVTGKVEFNVSKKLKAGLQYRGGVNNLIQNRNYLERDYMQVQLKYTILNK